MATVYGGPVLVGSPDVDPPFRAMDKKSGHLDWCAVDWTDPDMKFALAFKHEAGGLLLLSRDAGKTFTEGDKGLRVGGVGVRSADGRGRACERKGTPKGGIVRTTDGGKTFTPWAKAPPCRCRGGRARGCTGSLKGAPEGDEKARSGEGRGRGRTGRYGPVFGKDAKQMFILTTSGVIESADAGGLGAPVAVPKELKGVSALTWLDYDPKSDVLYVMKMGSDLYKLPRAK